MQQATLVLTRNNLPISNCSLPIGNEQLALSVQFLHALLAGDSLTRALAGAGVRTGALDAVGQVSAVAAATVAVDVLEPLDVLLNLTAEGAFDHVRAVDDVDDAADLVFVELAGLLHRIDVGLFEDFHGIDRANAIDVTKRDAN